MPHYVITAIALTALYVSGIYGLRYIRSQRLANILFPIIVFLPYLYGVIYMYIDVGVKDWNFLNTLPTANVSPFMCCLTLLTIFMPKKVKEYVFTLIALLSLGVFCAGMLTCVSNALRDYAFHWMIALDSFAHVALSLFGVCLVKSGQASLEIKHSLTSGLLIVGVAGIMLILNLIFHTSFFGLNLYGNHNIYNMVLFAKGYVSAMMYFVGLCVVLMLGYGYQKLLQRSK
ncbi:MAG: hypothetical protein E7371_05715 [Clostridiales bacterium]|nr:hypothetical protein [Clostridiales bacterium]